ncbi:MAG TPA: DUF167 domain-containing protein [Phycisphaerales bacterium]
MSFLTTSGPDVLIRLKVVPGSSRDALGGVLGERLKVKVAAAPEHGKANDAVCGLIARLLDVKPRDVTVESGTTSPEKTIRVRSISATVAAQRLGIES